VSIDWGDGTALDATSGLISNATGTFTVIGTHTFAEEGSYTVTTKVDHEGVPSSFSSTATVADAPLTATSAAPGFSPQALSGSLATFTDADPNGAVSDYVATIDWGDGSTSGATISGGPTFTASGSHTYGSTGHFTVTTSISDHGNTTVATCNVLVFGFAPGGGSFVVGDRNSANGTQVTFWGARWSKTNSLSGGSAPAAFKGYARNPTTPSVGTRWSTDPGNSAPPPNGPLPAYMAVIVSGSISNSGSQISGDTARIVIVATDTGYDGNPGHSGTGTVVAALP
jgi:hypothetical protein